MTTTDASARRRPAWRHWLSALLAMTYLVAFSALVLDLPARAGEETSAAPPARRITATTRPARPGAPPRVVDLDPRDARPGPASRVAPEPRAAPSRARPTRRTTRRIRTRSS